MIKEFVVFSVCGGLLTIVTGAKVMAKGMEYFDWIYFGMGAVSISISFFLLYVLLQERREKKK